VASVIAVSSVALTGAMDSSRAEELVVVAATTDLGALAEAVGGERIEIEVIARPDRDLHALEIRPSAMRDAARADVYLAVGLSLDLWSQGVVAGSRNRDLVVIDCSDAVEPLEKPTGRVTARMGDVHPEGNPHYWLDPLNAIAIADMLASRFGRLDPPGARIYLDRAEAFAGAIRARMPIWRSALEGRTFVTYHRSWVYLAERFGARVAGSVEPLPGIPPSARHLAELEETIRREGISIVIREPYHPADPVELLVRDTGVRAVVLPMSCPEPTGESYKAHLDEIAGVFERLDGRREAEAP
jgi:zinc/manganese transport system substrate-binding protein